VSLTGAKAPWDAIPANDGALHRGPSLAEQVHQTLRRWVIEGALQPGVVISENDLARRFAISRAPLREAVRRLQEEGLLNASGPRGFTIPPLTVDMVRQVYGVRLALEVSAAATTPEVPKAEIAAMKAKMKMIERAMKKGDLGPFSESDFEFHDLFIQHCGNPMLISHIERIRGHVQRIINFATQLDEHSRTSFQEHELILAAMESGDSERLRKTVEAHISGVTARLVDQLSEV
jgi:DNA-binding GntR family transcriptional regulator